MSDGAELIQLHGFNSQGQARFEDFLQKHVGDLTTAQIVQMSAECLTVLEKAFNEGVVFPVWEMQTGAGETARFLPTIDDLIIE